MKKLIYTILFIFAVTPVFNPAKSAGKKKDIFEIGEKSFYLNGKPFVIKAAELHYPRIPKEYWEHRISACKSMGMNTICLYVFWNSHEPVEGKFDFSGNNDVAAFCKLAQKQGMYIIIRPGPYVCAEWDMGGLPWWLLKKENIRLRENDPYFLNKVSIFMKEVGKRLAPMQVSRGGNILMVQVENEYGSFGKDKPYVAAIRDIVRNSGFDKVPLFQCDWNSNFENNALEDLLWTINFGTGADIDEQFKRLLELQPNTPLMCSEYWSGWFDHWGAKHETRPAGALIDGMKKMLDRNISFSLYMTHGGTSFGHWAGANSPNYVPTCTSYDYDAPIGESGNFTPKYYEIRNLLKNYLQDGEELIETPDSIPTITIPEMTFEETAYVFDNLPEPKKCEKIRPMEFFDQGWGSILYRTKLEKCSERRLLKITDAHDWAQVFINGERIGVLSRLRGDAFISIPPVSEGDRLDILVEAMGRINFGKGIYDRKGITDKVELINDTQATELKNWMVYNLPSDYKFAKNKKYKKQVLRENEPAYYRTSFNLDKIGDTFIDMTNWKKGMVYVNGRNIGRFWEIGPQQTLYLPGCWLKKGKNEIIILDMTGPSTPVSQGLRNPILNIVRSTESGKHRKPDENLNLENETPVMAGSFMPGQGWQTIRFDKNKKSRYFCLEALNSHGNDPYASIAELELLDADGEKISRQNWKIIYADSEEVNAANNTAPTYLTFKNPQYGILPTPWQAIRHPTISSSIWEKSWT